MRYLLTSIFCLFLSFSYAQSEFITTWKTDNPGVSEDNQIRIPTFPGETYDYTIDWGDGTIEQNVSGDAIHTYDIPGIYQVSISGEFPGIVFNDNGDKQKIISVDQWGSIEWVSFGAAFSGCNNLDVLALDTPNLSKVSSLELMFYKCSSLIGTASFNDWDVSSVTNTSAMFSGANNFNANISDWDVSSVIYMANMFQYNYRELECKSG